MEFELDFEEFTLSVEVTYYHKQPADYYADNPDDCYGYTEIDYKVLGGSKYNEDAEDMEEISLQEAVDKADELSDIIWDRLNNELTEGMEDDY